MWAALLPLLFQLFGILGTALLNWLQGKLKKSTEAFPHPESMGNAEAIHSLFTHAISNTHGPIRRLLLRSLRHVAVGRADELFEAAKSGATAITPLTANEIEWLSDANAAVAAHEPDLAV